MPNASQRRLLVLATAGVVLATTVPAALAATPAHATVHANATVQRAAAASAGSAATHAVLGVARTATVGKSLTATLTATVLPHGDKAKTVTINWGDKTKLSTGHSLAAHLRHTYAKPGNVRITATVLDIHKRTFRTTAPVTVSAKPMTALVKGTVTASASDLKTVTSEAGGVKKLVVGSGLKPVVGKPFVVPVSKALPSGILGKVTKVTPAAGGGSTVIVAPAKVDQVYTHFVVDKSETLGSSGAFVTSTDTPAVQHPALEQAHIAQGLSPFSFLPFVCSVKGKFVHRIDVNLNKLVVSNHNSFGAFDLPIFLQLELKGPITANLTAGFGGKAVCQLSPKIAIFIPIVGPLGVKIQPVLKLEGDGALTVATTIVDNVDVALYVGTDGSSLHHTSTTSVVSVAVDGKATLTGTVGLAVGLSLGGVATVGGEIDAIAKAAVTTPGSPDVNGHDIGTVCVAVTGYLQGSLFVDLNLFFFHVKKNFAEFKLSPVLAIAQGCHVNPGPLPTPPPSTPGPAPTTPPAPPAPGAPTPPSNADAFGSNSSGQLGSGSTASGSTTPTPVAGGHTFTQVVGSALDGYGLTTGGDVYAWGTNGNQELGTTGPASSVPVLVSLPFPATQIASSATANGAYALLNNGTVYYWGSNSTGQGGQNTGGADLAPSQVPIPSNGSSAILAIAATGGSGYAVTDANTDNGTVYAWGANYAGQLGNGGTAETDTPTISNNKGNPLRYVTAIFPGGNATVFLTVDGDTEAMGDNSTGEYGNGSTTSNNIATPGAASALPDLSANSTRSFALAYGTTYAVQDGVAYAWGADDKGQLGDGKTATETTGGPIADIRGRTITQVSGGVGTGYALDSDGTTYAYGANSVGQLGNGGTSTAAGGFSAVSSVKATGLGAGGTTGYVIVGR